MAIVTEQSLERPLFDLSSEPEERVEEVSMQNGSSVGTTVSLNSPLVIRLLATVTVVLVIASTVAQYAYISSGYSSITLERLVKVVSVDLELNVPTFFSMLLFLAASLLLAYISAHLFKQKARYRWHWAMLSFGFLFMAFDEIVAAHERTVEPLRALLGGENLGVFYFAWVVPAIGVVLFLAVVFFKFWLNLPSRTRWYSVIGATLFLGGTIGMELIDGRYAEIYGKDNMTYMLLTTVEESLEMAGIIVFIGGLLHHIADHFGGIRISMNYETR